MHFNTAWILQNHEYCTWTKAWGASSGEVLYGVGPPWGWGQEDRRTGGEEDRRTAEQEDSRTGGQEDRRTGGQDFPALHGTLSPSRATWSGGNRHFQRRGSHWGQAFPVLLRGGGTGVPSGVGTGVSAQPLLVPVNAMGTSVSSMATYTSEGAVGIGGPRGAWGQDWRSQCCMVRGGGVTLVGMVFLARMDVVWVGWWWALGGWLCWGSACVGIRVGLMWGELAPCEVSWCSVVWVNMM